MLTYMADLLNGGKAIVTKKNTTRQTTLFGLPPPAPVEKSDKRGRKKKALGEDDERSKSKAGTPDVQAPVSEDVNMDPQATEIYTTQEGESQPIETQTMAAESSQTLVQTQVEVGSFWTISLNRQIADIACDQDSRKP